MIRHTTHSLGQCKERGINPDVALNRVLEVQGKVLKSSAPEVVVVLHKSAKRVYFSNGDCGDVIVACIDPQRQTIKTITWQRREQVYGKIKYRGSEVIGEY